MQTGLPENTKSYFSGKNIEIEKNNCGLFSRNIEWLNVFSNIKCERIPVRKQYRIDFQVI
jgi:hypothetical protein